MYRYIGNAVVFFVNDNFLKLVLSITLFLRCCAGMTSGIHRLILDLFIPYPQPSSVIFRDPSPSIKKEGLETIDHLHIFVFL